ncbi:hypothetical protein GCM10009679_45930 [Saccharothrix algeriensis]|uniref:Uncharacterized protein n=1 Tax=Catellatospora bangladeshensis TaxID=310355 RepID=A0A8J3JSS1_9ACTN|nr:hypothetical protein Cba03nite_58290 [Catellatospora bangladeshensis]
MDGGGQRMPGRHDRLTGTVLDRRVHHEIRFYRITQHVKELRVCASVDEACTKGRQIGNPERCDGSASRFPALDGRKINIQHFGKLGLRQVERLSDQLHGVAACQPAPTGQTSTAVQSSR